MKLFNAITAAAVIGTSLITATPAEARNGWVYITDYDGASNYMKYVGRSGNIVTTQEKWSDLPRIRTHKYNCSTWMRQIVGEPWEPIYPGSVAEAKAKKVC